MDLLTRYWFKFDGADNFVKWVGVTAYSIEDARGLMQQNVFINGQMPEPVTVTENIDVSMLDEGHVLPNIGMPTIRGVWYPNLNSY